MRSEERKSKLPKPTSNRFITRSAIQCSRLVGRCLPVSLLLTPHSSLSSQPPLHQLPPRIEFQAGARGGGFVVAVGAVGGDVGPTCRERHRPVRVRPRAEGRAVV